MVLITNGMQQHLHTLLPPTTGKNVGASGYRGVKVPTQAHGPGSYEGRYSLNKQQKTICYSSDPVEAAKAFNNAAVYLFDSKYDVAHPPQHPATIVLNTSTHPPTPE